METTLRPAWRNTKEIWFCGGTLFRNVNNPNELVILFKADDLEKARKSGQAEDLRQRMQQAGMVDQPTVLSLEKIAQFGHWMCRIWSEWHHLPSR